MSTYLADKAEDLTVEGPSATFTYRRMGLQAASRWSCCTASAPPSTGGTRSSLTSSQPTTT